MQEVGSESRESTAFVDVGCRKVNYLEWECLNFLFGNWLNGFISKFVNRGNEVRHPVNPFLRFSSRYVTQCDLLCLGFLSVGALKGATSERF